MRLLERYDTGRFLVPYFILIFANVKIKDKSEYSRDLTNRKKKKHTYTQGGPSNNCVQLLIRHLYSSFIFDAQLLLDLAFLERDGGNDGAVRNQH